MDKEAQAKAMECRGAAWLRAGAIPNNTASVSGTDVLYQYWFAALDCFNEAKRLRAHPTPPESKQP